MQAEALLDHAAFVRDLARALTFGGEDPDDVVQQTWLAAVESPPAPGPGIRAWLATCARNALRQSRRSAGRRLEREARSARPEAVPTAREIREREAVRGEVVEAVLALDEPYRAAILPAPNERARPGASIAFTLQAEGICRGGPQHPNLEVPFAELARRTAEARPGPAILTVPALDSLPIAFTVKTPAGRPVEGVQVAARPVSRFAEAVRVSNAEGRVVFHLTADDAFLAAPASPGEGSPGFVAAAPWIGRLDLSVLTLDAGPRRPPPDLIVRKSMEIGLRFVDEAGAPLASTEVRIGREDLETDAAGVARWTVPEAWAELTLSADGRVPVILPSHVLDDGKEIRLEAGREVTVRLRTEDSRPAWVRLVAVEPGGETRIPETGPFTGSEAHRLVLPPRRVVVRVDPSMPTWVGEVAIAPDATEAELTLRAAPMTGPRIR